MLLIRLQKRPGIAVITPENVDDLWTIRRIVIPKDIISGHTKRVIKDKSEHARPGKGERIRVKLSIEVEKINLDHLLERIRISGKIVETSDESISKGAYHSFNLTIGNSIIIKNNYCILPKPLAVGYSIAIAISGKAEQVFLAGFDGFKVDDPHNDETNQIIEILKKSYNKFLLTSLTPTKYNIKYKSINSLKLKY